MTGFLRALAERGLGRGPTLQVRVRSRFEPAPNAGGSEGWSATPDGGLEETVEVPSAPDLRARSLDEEPRPAMAGRLAAPETFRDREAAAPVTAAARTPAVERAPGSAPDASRTLTDPRTGEPAQARAGHGRRSADGEGTRSGRSEPPPRRADTIANGEETERGASQRRAQVADAGRGDASEMRPHLGQGGPTRPGDDGRLTGSERARLERDGASTAGPAGQALEPRATAARPAQRSDARPARSGEGGGAPAGRGVAAVQPAAITQGGPTRPGDDGRSTGSERARLERGEAPTARPASEAIEPMATAAQPARRSDTGRGVARDLARPGGASAPATRSAPPAEITGRNDPAAASRPGTVDAGSGSRSFATARPSPPERAMPAPPPVVVVDRRSPASMTRPAPPAETRVETRDDRGTAKPDRGNVVLAAEVVAPRSAPSSQARGDGSAQSGQRQPSRPGASSGAKAAAASSSDRVSIQIGRLEVRAVPAEAAPARAPAPQAQGLSLDAYLQQLGQRAK